VSVTHGGGGSGGGGWCRQPALPLSRARAVTWRAACRTTRTPVCQIHRLHSTLTRSC